MTQNSEKEGRSCAKPSIARKSLAVAVVLMFVVFTAMLATELRAWGWGWGFWATVFAGLMLIAYVATVLAEPAMAWTIIRKLLGVALVLPSALFAASLVLVLRLNCWGFQWRYVLLTIVGCALFVSPGILLAAGFRLSFRKHKGWKHPLHVFGTIFAVAALIVSAINVWLGVEEYHFKRKVESLGVAELYQDRAWPFESAHMCYVDGRFSATD